MRSRLTCPEWIQSECPRARSGRPGWWHSLVLGLIVLAAVQLRAEGPSVVLNEIMYHPPDDQESLQYVELHNRGETAVNLTKWAFTKGIRFTFPESTTIAPGGYLVVCRDLEAFAGHYGQEIPTAGPFAGKLSHKGDRLELVDASSRLVDTVKYADGGAWPAGPDGYSSSLERISPDAESDSPSNWSASAVPATRRPAGSPGRQNDSFSSNLPPLVSNVEFSPKAPSPAEAVTVTATVADPDGVGEVVLLFRLAGPRQESEELPVAMTRQAGDAKSGAYTATLDPQPHGQLVRFRIKAVDTGGGQRFAPGVNEPRPSFSYFSFTNSAQGRIPLAHLVNIGRPGRGPGHYERVPARRAAALVPVRGQGAMLYVPADGGEPLTFDYVRIVSRHGGVKVRFQKDQRLKGMSTVNLISEGPMRWIIAEPLAYVLHRLAGVPCPLTEHVRVSIDGRNLGFQLLVEQPNTSFLERYSRDPDGDLYKLIWYGQDIIGQHEKKTNPSTGHRTLVELIEGLQRRSGAEQWAFIQQHFNVEEVASYYAVNMCLQNWDGFFNNYYAYHDLKGSGKWEIYPWDQDKTWGDYDGASPDYDWYTMPLTMGMTGDRSPRSFGSGRGPFGGMSWWRPPGYFSGPLLANPQFRKVFLARLHDLCTTTFTEQNFLPIIDTMQQRLEPEVRLRAQATGQNPQQALRELTGYMDSFRRQVKHRREFILNQLAKSK